jgi:hypothetical protein
MKLRPGNQPKDLLDEDIVPIISLKSCELEKKVNARMCDDEGTFIHRSGITVLTSGFVFP